MENFIIVAVLIAIIGAAVIYIVKEKKRGVKCIGCPAAGQCSRSRNLGCGCHADTKE